MQFFSRRKKISHNKNVEFSSKISFPFNSVKYFGDTGTYHWHNMTHSDVGIFVDTFDGGWQITWFTHVGDGGSDTQGHGDANKGNPKYVIFFGDDTDEVCIGERMPNIFQHPE